MSDEKHDDHGGGGGEGGHGGGGGGGHGGGGHGGGGAHEEHEGAPEWLISFADNVALMMGFFVILLAMNMGPKATAVQGGEPSDRENNEVGKQADYVISIRDAFNNPVKLDSNDPAEAWLRKRIKQRKGGPTNEAAVEGNHPDAQATRPSDYKNISALIEFDERSSLLTQGSKETLAEVARKLKGQRWIVELRGHVSPYEFPRNPRKKMELSYERAMAVAASLVDFGMAWDHLAVVAKGDSDPLVARPEDAEEGKVNERVEVVVTNDLALVDPYAVKAKPASRTEKPPERSNDADEKESSHDEEKPSKPHGEGGH
jgi:flagellar motor protein MotB